jgi:S-disulfanyl-L-cysteine oxidoreductase SoxD
MNHNHRRRINNLSFWCCCGLYLLALPLIAMAARSSSHAETGTASGQNPPQVTDIWQGIFTEQQAERGQGVFEAHCAVCHDASELGEAPALAADTFLRSWEGHTVGRLYTKILEMMPPTDVQSVSAPQKLDVLTFILRENGFPTGRDELTADAARFAKIKIVPQGGPAPLRTGAMVQVVGCLAKAEGNTWLLRSSTEPEATTLDRAAAGAADANASRTLGTQTVRLLAVFPAPEAMLHHRVEAKGLLVRTDADIAVNVVALRSVSPRCP